MIGNGFPYKFVTIYINEEYFCFLQVNDTVKEMNVEFLIIILGDKYCVSKDYGVTIYFAGSLLPHNKPIKDVFQTKNGNNIMFVMPSQVKSRPMKRKRKKSVINGKLITLVNAEISINDSDNKRDHYITSWQDSSDIISKKVFSTPVIIIPKCIKNNKFAVELLKNNDSFIQTNNDVHDPVINILQEKRQ